MDHFVVVILSRSGRYRLHTWNGGRGPVVRELEFKSKDPGFEPLVGQGEEQFFCPSESTLVQTCVCLTPLLVYGTTHPNLSAR